MLGVRIRARFEQCKHFVLIICRGRLVQLRMLNVSKCGGRCVQCADRNCNSRERKSDYKLKFIHVRFPSIGASMLVATSKQNGWPAACQ